MYLFKNRFVSIYKYESAPQQLEPEESLHQGVTHVSPAWKNFAAFDDCW